MRILVTGGAGFIGSNFVRGIAAGSMSGISSVVVLDKLTYAGVLSNLDSAKAMDSFRFVEGNICDSRFVTSLLADFDAIVNFAAESHVDRSIGSAAEFVDTNVGGVQVLLDAIKASGRDIRFVQVSTDEVYGSIDSSSWTEEWPLQPNSPYSASKAGGELLARAYYKTHGLDVVTTRCSNNYGTHHFPEKLIPLFVTNLLEGKKVPIYGDGKNVRDWLHVDDHCRALDLVLHHGRPAEVYNIGGGTELSNRQLTQRLLNACGTDWSSVDEVPDRQGHDRRYSLDSTRIQQELGFTPSTQFDDGLRSTIEWYRSHRDWWEPLTST